jgi:hypothetical protein
MLDDLILIGGQLKGDKGGVLGPKGTKIDNDWREMGEA